MSYPTVPNTFTSASTFLATQVNANFSSITADLSSGSKDLNLYNINTNTFVVSSGIVVTSDITVQASLTGTSLTGTLEAGNASLSNLILQTETVSVTDDAITPAKAHVKVTGTHLSYINLDNMVDGDILILSKATTAVTVDSTVADSNLKLGAATRVLTNDSDKLILQYCSSNFYELQFQSNG